MSSKQDSMLDWKVELMDVAPDPHPHPYPIPRCSSYLLGDLRPLSCPFQVSVPPAVKEK